MSEDKFLKDVPSSHAFKLLDGRLIYNIYQLLDILKTIDKNVFDHHVNIHKDDFANWIADQLDNKPLAEELRKIHDMKKYLKLLEKTVKSREIDLTSYDTLKYSKSWHDHHRQKLQDLERDFHLYEKRLQDKHQELDDLIAQLVEKNVSLILSKRKTSFKEELDKTTNFNAQLEKKFEHALLDKEQHLENSIKTISSSILKKSLEPVLTQQKAIIEQEKIKSMKDSENLLMNFDKSVSEKLHSLPNIVSVEVDKHLSHTVTKNKSIIESNINASLNRLSSTKQEFDKAIIETKKKLMDDIQNSIQIQLKSSITKQREILDTELAKALKSSKYFEERFENAISAQERKLENYIENAVNNELSTTIPNFRNQLASELSKVITKTKDLDKQVDDVITQKTSALIAFLNQNIEKSISENINKQMAVANDRFRSYDSSFNVRESALKSDVTNLAITTINEKLGVEVLRKTKEMEAKLDKATREKQAALESSVSKVIHKELSEAMNDFKSQVSLELEQMTEKSSGMEKEIDKIIEDHTGKLAASLTRNMEKSMSENVSKHLNMLSEKIRSHEAFIKSKESSIKDDIKSNILSQVSQRFDAELNKRLKEVDQKATDYIKEVQSKIEKNANATIKELMTKTAADFRYELNDDVSGFTAKIQNLDTQVDTVITQKTAIITDSLNKSFQNTLNENTNKQLALVSEKIKSFEDSVKEREASLKNEIKEMSVKILGERLDAEIPKRIKDIDSRVEKTILAYADKELEKLNVRLKNIAQSFDAHIKSREQQLLNQTVSEINRKASQVIRDRDEMINKLVSDAVIKAVDARNDHIIKYTEKLVYDSLNKGSTAYQEKIRSMVSKEYSQLTQAFSDYKKQITQQYKESQDSIGSIISSRITDATNKTFAKALNDQKQELVDQKQELVKEMSKSSNFIRDLDKRFNDIMKQKENYVIDMVSKDYEKKITQLISKQQNTLNTEITKISLMSKGLERNSKRYESMIEELTMSLKKNQAMIKEIDTIKGIRKALVEDRDSLAKELTDNRKIIDEIKILKDSLSKDKNYADKKLGKSEIYLMLSKCKSLMSTDNISELKSTYDSLSELFKKSELDSEERKEIYAQIISLYKEINTKLASKQPLMKNSVP